MERTITKHALAWVVALMVALLALPGMAFADTLASATVSPQADDAAPWTDWKDSDVIFTVKYKTKMSDPAIETAITKERMVELAQANTTPMSYAFSGKNGLEVVVATQYVTIAQLLGEANITPNDAGDYVTISDEAATKPFTSAGYFESISSSKRYFYPNYSSADPKNVETTAGEAYQTALSASHHESLRNLWGITEDDLNAGNTGGKPYVNGAASLTYEQRPFTLYTRTGAGEKTVVKKYLQGDLEALATDAPNGQGYLMASGSDWGAFATTQYVTYDALFKDAGITPSADNVFVAAAADGFSSTLTYDQLTKDINFYGGTTKGAIDESLGALPAPAALALNWTQVTTMEGETTAFQALQAAVQGTLKTQYRTFVGVSEDNYKKAEARGNRFATGPVDLSVVAVKDIASNDVVVEGVDAAYDFTGAAIEPQVTVTDGSATLSVVNKKGVGDYTVSYEANKNAGTGKVIIEGKNSYKGKKEVNFKINKANQTVIAKNKTIKLKAKKLKKKAQTVAAAKVTKDNSATTAITYSLKKVNKSKKKFKVAADGKITVKKKLKKGKYTLTITATAAGANYNTVTKDFKVTIKVK